MTDTKIPRLALVTSDYHYVRDGRIYTTSAFMRFVPELLRIARRIEVVVPVHPEAEDGGAGFTIESSHLAYSPLPPSRTLEEFLRRFPRDGLAIIRTLYRSIRVADLVWINGPHPLLPLAVALCNLLRTPCMLWLRGNILTVVRAKYVEPKLRDRLAMRTALYLDRLIGLCAWGTAVFYTGRELQRYTRLARYSQLAMASLVQPAQLADAPHPVARSPFRLLWAGQLRPLKGLPFLLRATRQLLDEGLPVHVTLVGDGEQRDELEAERARLGLAEAVTLEGYVRPGPELDRYFRDADAFVLPSLSEGVPKALLEAMAHALPVIASRVGGVPDIVEDGVNGLLVPPADACSLASAIRRVATDDALRLRLGSGALAFARQHTAPAEVERLGEGLRKAVPEVWGY